MTHKAFTIIAVILAVVLAILGSVLPPAYIQNVMLITNFFDIMIPVLAAAALLKYLCSGQLKD